MSIRAFNRVSILGLALAAIVSCVPVPSPALSPVSGKSFKADTDENGTFATLEEAEIVIVETLPSGAPADGVFLVGDGSTYVKESGSTVRTSLGLGTIATQNSNSVTITGGSVTGITDLAVTDGGTGASDASGARTNLGLVIGTNVQAYDAELQALSGTTSAADALPYFTGSGTAGTTTLTSFARTILDDADAATVRTTIGAGTIGGSTGSTDNRVLRADGTGGATVQDSLVAIDDSGNVTGIVTLGCTSVQAAGGMNSGTATVQDGSVNFYNTANSYFATLTASGITGANKTLELPDASGTLALTTRNVVTLSGTDPTWTAPSGSIVYCNHSTSVTSTALPAASAGTWFTLIQGVNGGLLKPGSGNSASIGAGLGGGTFADTDPFGGVTAGATMTIYAVDSTTWYGLAEWDGNVGAPSWRGP